MKKRIGLGVALALALSLSWFLGGQTRQAEAEHLLHVPRSYGACRGGVGSFLIFEDSNGAVRLVDFGGTLNRTLNRD